MIPSVSSSVSTPALDALANVSSADQITGQGLNAVSLELSARAVACMIDAANLQTMREAVEAVLKRMGA